MDVTKKVAIWKGQQGRQAFYTKKEPDVFTGEFYQTFKRYNPNFSKNTRGGNTV